MQYKLQKEPRMLTHEFALHGNIGVDYIHLRGIQHICSSMCMKGMPCEYVELI